jgi:hypothetical protein
VQAPFHQELAFALMHQLHGAFGRRVAVRSVDDLKAMNFDSILGGDLVDLGGRPDEDRLDDPEFRRLDWSAERGFIARMYDDRLRRRDLLCPGDQTLVFRFWGMGRRTYGLKRAYFTLAFPWHAAPFPSI